MTESKKYVDLIAHNKRKTFKVDELYNILADNDIETAMAFKTTRYTEFHEIVTSLEREAVISPTSRLTNQCIPPLYIKYKKVTAPKEQVTAADNTFLHGLHPDITTKHYPNNPKLFKEHKQYLEILDNFLTHKDEYEPLSVKERSYELFKDEKFLQSHNVITRTRISYEQLNCLQNPPPLQCFIGRNFYTKECRNILFIENLDTYWTFHRLIFSEGLIDNFDMVVYGGGYATTDRRLDFTYYRVTDKDTIHYFGDLDAEGIRIYLLLKEKHPHLNLQLAHDAYSVLMKIGEKRGFGRKETQHEPPNLLFKTELDTVPPHVKEMWVRVVLDKLFVPQEALNIALLRRAIIEWMQKNS